MRLAWFRPTAPSRDPLDDTAPLVDALRPDHHIDVVTRDSAHAFAARHNRPAYDLCVFELDNTPAHAYVWPYLLHHPGALLLRSTTLHDSRAAALLHEHRIDDYLAEVAFNEGQAPRLPRIDGPIVRASWPMLRVPLAASRLTVVLQESVAAGLRRRYPEAHIRFAPPAIADAAVVRKNERRRDIVRVGTLAGEGAAIGERAVARARQLGAPAELTVADSAAELLGEVDVVMALDWRSSRAAAVTAAALAAGLPVVTVESEAVADWPALDPQCWKARARDSRAPVVVSADPRDEEHSVMLAVRRLAGDAALREALGAAGRDWWRSRATVTHAAEAWRDILREAAAVPPPPRPAGWPVHLDAGVSDEARAWR